MKRFSPPRFSVEKQQVAEFGVTKLPCALENLVEDRFDLARRAADHLEHVGGCDLLLQRFLKVRRFRLNLVEQPRVLDGNHRLVGERLK